MRALVLAFTVVLGSCAVGSPPGFSDGDSWSFPLVGTLETGPLLAPVKLDGKGPYLFVIDPDLGVSAVDPALASELELLPMGAMQVLNHDDVNRPFGRAQIMEIEVGDLTVRNRVVFIKPPMLVRGRWVRGTLGRDVIAPSLIWAIDRDRGMSVLATQDGLKPPPGAKKIDYSLTLDRFLTDVTINGKHEAILHIDLGNHTSTLWPSKQKKFGLPRIPRAGYLRDEFGFTKETDTVAIAAKLRAGQVEGSGIELQPMSDGRIMETDYDGELGQNFFHPYNLTVNYHKTEIWLEPRSQDLIGMAKERMRRWGTRFDACTFAACVQSTLEPIGGSRCAAPSGGEGGPTPDAITGDPSAGADAAPAAPCDDSAAEFYQLKIGREALARELEYEVTLLAVDDSGAPIGTAPLVATLPKGAEFVYHPLRDPAYARAKSFLAIDMSPFPRPCDQVGDGYRCVWTLE